MKKEFFIKRFPISTEQSQVSLDVKAIEKEAIEALGETYQVDNAGYSFSDNYMIYVVELSKKENKTVGFQIGGA